MVRGVRPTGIPFTTTIASLGVDSICKRYSPSASGVSSGVFELAPPLLPVAELDPFAGGFFDFTEELGVAAQPARTAKKPRVRSLAKNDRMLI